MTRREKSGSPKSLRQDGKRYPRDFDIIQGQTSLHTLGRAKAGVREAWKAAPVANKREKRARRIMVEQGNRDDQIGSNLFVGD